MLKLDIVNNFIYKSDLDYIKNRLHFDISDENLEELLLLLSSTVDMRGADTIKNLKNEVEYKLKKEWRYIDADVDIDTEAEECISDFLKKDNVKEVIYQGIRNAIINNDDNPESITKEIISDIIDEIPESDCKISVSFDISDQLGKIINEVFNEMLDEFEN